MQAGELGRVRGAEHPKWRGPFEAHYHEDENGCWIWHQVSYHGYGSYWYQGRQHPAHRASWMIHRGEIPAGMIILHACDVRACVNPDHLSVGTHQDNSDDMVARGRQWRGGNVRKQV